MQADSICRDIPEWRGQAVGKLQRRADPSPDGTVISVPEAFTLPILLLVCFPLISELRILLLAYKHWNNTHSVSDIWGQKITINPNFSDTIIIWCHYKDCDKPTSKMPHTGKHFLEKYERSNNKKYKKMVNQIKIWNMALQHHSKTIECVNIKLNKIVI